MAPEALDTREADELCDLALRVRAWQQAQLKPLSDSALLRKFPDLGSTKTFTRILLRDLEQLDLVRQLTNYRAVMALIESLGDDQSAEEELYDSFTAAAQLRRAFFETQRETGPARFILVQGASGTGKTSARRVLCARFGTRTLTVEASAAWNDSPGAFLGEVLVALGSKYIPAGHADRLTEVLAKLRESRRCIVIEEGHHLGPRSLNVVKSILNQSPGEIIILAIPTLWNRLASSAYEEARQLSGNRLAERIQLTLGKGDVEKLIRFRVPGLDPEALPKVVRLCCEHAPKYGNLAFVREVCSRLAREHRGGAVSLEDFTQAASAEVASR